MKRLKLETIIALGFGIILNPPNAVPQTISPGHCFGLRYVTKVQNDFQDVAGVWRKRLALPEFQIDYGA
jgi:hypothetical protein